MCCVARASRSKRWSRGIPIVATRGTTHAEQSEQFGAEVLCEDGSVESLCEAIRQVEDSYASLREKACARAQAASAYFSVANFQKLIIDNTSTQPYVKRATDEERGATRNPQGSIFTDCQNWIPSKAE